MPYGRCSSRCRNSGYPSYKGGRLSGIHPWNRGSQTVINAVNSGKVVTIPAKDVTMGDWHGTGYIIMNPETGIGSYMISGGLNGGAIDVIATVTFLAAVFAAIADVAVLLYITVLAIWNLPFITASASAEICFTTIMLMLPAMDMARTASEDYYAYWESGNEQEIEQMAEKALWLGLVLAATGAWVYCIDEMNQMGAGGGGSGGGSSESGNEIIAKAKIEKFSEFIFKDNATHGKNIVFENLGYSKEDSKYLTNLYIEQASEKFTRGEYTFGKLDQYGQRINIEIELKGIGECAGKVSYIKSGWMINSDGTISLNTPFSGFTR